MPRFITASDRSALIRLASSMERGSEERRAILAGLKMAAPSLDSVVLGALREGRWSRLPRIGEFRVVNGLIDVSVRSLV